MISVWSAMNYKQCSPLPSILLMYGSLNEAFFVFFVLWVKSRLYVQYKYKSLHGTFRYPSMWYYTFHIILGLWSLEISSCGTNPEDVCGLSRAVTPALPPLSLCQAEKPPRIPFLFFLRHSTYITTQSSFRLMWSCSSAHISSTQALCRHVTLLSKPLKEDSDFFKLQKEVKEY